MKQMWKYELKIGEKNTISIPADAIIRAVQMQANIPCIWAEVETNHERHERTFRFFPTGGGIDQPSHYIGTVQLGWTVWHLYEIYP